ncbi:hypothetical protein JTE90_023391 [Oedothorax gibbosus]|uniref:Uncharacterized protein n=1 Tax=Oedothorax gibbosus TaxID=931172 RepID=A0AAV6UFA3_9ARAC|nr:hypothetical protein JTE90_023391 [Oedothorax gibbosus]
MENVPFFPDGKRAAERNMREKRENNQSDWTSLLNLWRKRKRNILNNMLGKSTFNPNPNAFSPDGKCAAERNTLKKKRENYWKSLKNTWGK